MKIINHISKEHQRLFDQVFLLQRHTFNAEEALEVARADLKEAEDNLFLFKLKSKKDK